MKPKINKSGGYLIFSFSGLDWNKYHILDLIDEIKKTIPPNCRSYNKATFEWSVTKEGYQHVINDMFERYFADPNQIDMFL